ncbi:MAG: prenyltransferase [Theionarchaea archaeon]|nr:prenyltransferase [Theionarchaea archaeon]MBU7040479.1 prenyltransferase [Theionarchaea archaeon]
MVVNPWVRAVRLQYYPTTGMILVVGISASVFTGIVFSMGIVWMVAANVLFHCACSLINEYSDFVSGADLVEYPESRWSATGGSSVLKEQLLQPRQVLRVSLFLFCVSWIIWVVLGYWTDHWIILVMSGALSVTYLYSAALSVGGFYYYRDVALSLGSVPLVVVSVAKVLTTAYSVTALAAGIVAGTQILIYLLYHGIVDLDADSKSGKLRLSSVLGLERTRMASRGLLFLMVGTAVGLGYTGILPHFSVSMAVILPVAVIIMRKEKTQPLMKTYNQMVLLMGAAGGLLCAGFWVHLLL